MSTPDRRQPPRFVPTLTDVVAEQETAPVSVPSPALPPAKRQPMPQAMDTMLPKPEQNVDSIGLQGQASSAISAAEPDWSGVVQALQTRVMQRLDENLEERLRYALTELVQLHTQTLHQAIRSELERLVSSAVHEALAQELDAMNERQSGNTAPEQ